MVDIEKVKEHLVMLIQKADSDAIALDETLKAYVNLIIAKHPDLDIQKNIRLGLQVLQKIEELEISDIEKLPEKDRTKLLKDVDEQTGLIKGIAKYAREIVDNPNDEKLLLELGERLVNSIEAEPADL